MTLAFPSFMAVLSLPLAVALLVACDGTPPPASCPPPPAPDPTAQCLVPAEEVELRMIRRGSSLRLEGQAFAGVLDALLGEEGSPNLASCGITNLQSKVAIRRDLRAPAAWNASSVPLFVALDLACRAVDADVVATVGEIKADILSHRGALTLSKWALEGESRTLRPELPVDIVSHVASAEAPPPPGHGRLRVVGDGLDPVRFSPIAKADDVPPPVDVRDGAVLNLPVGIYRTPSGDHFGIREGRTTWFRPGNPMALVFDGRRFPLDDVVPALGVAGDFAFESPANMRRCKVLDKKGCFGQRPFRGEGAEDSDVGFLERLQLVDQVVFHIDGTADTPKAFEVCLGRGCSSHFDIDFDGGLVQGLDLVREAFDLPVGPWSSRQVHITLNNLMKNLVKEPSAAPWPADHPRSAEMVRHPRPKSPEMKIAYARVQSWGFTEAQWRTLGSVVRGLVGMLPGLAPTAVGGLGNDARDHLLEPTELGRPGFFGHYHHSEQRWDPGPGFDWERLMALIDAPPVEL
jgi:hypothetical protein